MTNNFTKHTFTQRYGMEGVGDMWAEWATDKELQEERQRHSTYVKECIAKGIYGQEYTTTIEIEKDPNFSKRPKSKKLTESYKMIIWDVNDKA